MSRCSKRWSFAPVLWLCAAASVLAADLVVLRDGSEFSGRLIEVDAQRAVIEVEGGVRKSVDRHQLLRVEFGELPHPPLQVRVKVADADDLVVLALDNVPLGTAAELKAQWVDLGPKLKEGANLLTASVENAAGSWAYRWLMEVGKERKTYACGIAKQVGCKRAGGSGQERGTFEVGRIWLYVRHETGEVKIVEE